MPKKGKQTAAKSARTVQQVIRSAADRLAKNKGLASAGVSPFRKGKTKRGDKGYWKASFADEEGNVVAESIVPIDDLREAGGINPTEWKRGRIETVDVVSIAHALNRELHSVEPRPARRAASPAKEEEEGESSRKGKRRQRSPSPLPPPPAEREEEEPAVERVQPIPLKAAWEHKEKPPLGIVLIDQQGKRAPPAEVGSHISQSELRALLRSGYSAMMLSAKEERMFGTLEEQAAAGVVGTILGMTAAGDLTAAERLEITKELQGRPLTPNTIYDTAADILRIRRAALERRLEQQTRRTKHLTKKELRDLLRKYYGD